MLLPLQKSIADETKKKTKHTNGKLKWQIILRIFLKFVFHIKIKEGDSRQCPDGAFEKKTLLVFQLKLLKCFNFLILYANKLKHLIGNHLTYQQKKKYQLLNCRYINMITLNFKLNVNFNLLNNI